jgi:cytokinin dehydrogenase
MSDGWTAEDVHALSQGQGVGVLSVPEAREASEVDFGRLVRRPVQHVFAPRSIAEVQRIVVYANRRKLQLTARGRGMSQGGQSIPAAGASIELSRLTELDQPDFASQSLRCSAGTTWRDAISMSAPFGLLPKVVPLNLDLTVGGLLSVAGVGATSHRYGSAVACVRELEVVTGGGRYVVCNATNERATYEASLGGLGRAALIVRAGVELRPFKPRVRTFYLLFEQVEAWLAAQRALIADGRADYLEGFCSPCVLGLRQTTEGRRPFAHWMYGLHASFEYDGVAPDERAVLGSLDNPRVLRHEDCDTVAYASRYDARFAAMRRSGAWSQPHPWVEAMLPGDKLSALLPEVLALYPPSFGDGPRLLFVARARTPPFLSLPAASEIACCALLPTGLPPHLHDDTLREFRAIHDIFVAAGGKRVLSGWTTMMDQRALDAHYGERAAAWAAARRSLDPARVLDTPVTSHAPDSLLDCPDSPEKGGVQST